MIPALVLAAALATDTVRHWRIRVEPGETLAVEVHESAGSTSPIVLIPGFLGGAEGFRKLVPLLEAQGFAPVIIEPLGTGESDRPARADYSFDAQAARLAVAFDSLRLSGVPVIAHSAGGAMAFRIAWQRPELIAMLLSLEGGPTEHVSTPEFRRAATFMPLARLLGGARLLRHVVHHTLIESSGDTRWVTDSVVQAWTERSTRDLGATVKVYRAMAASRERLPLAPHLAEITCRVHIMLGEARHDGAVDPAEIDELKRSVRILEIENVPGAGHYLQEERPDLVAQAMVRMRSMAPGRRAP